MNTNTNSHQLDFDVSSLSIEELNELRWKLKVYSKRKKEEKLEQLIEEKKKYVGKCYVRLFEYSSIFYKVISPIGWMEDDVTVISIELNLNIRENSSLADEQFSSYAYKQYFLDGGVSVWSDFDVKRNIENGLIKEISEEEWERAVDRFCEKVKELKI